MGKDVLNVVGEWHAVFFNKGKDGYWVEDRGLVDGAINAIKECSEPGDFVFFETEPFHLEELKEIIKWLKNQPNSKKLKFKKLTKFEGTFLKDWLKGLDSGNFKIEEVERKIGRFIHSARVIDFLNKTNRKVIPIESASLSMASDIAGALGKKSMVKDFSYLRDRNFVEKILRAYRKGKKAPLFVVGAGHLLSVADHLSKHFKVKARVVEPSQKNAAKLRRLMWKDSLKARERYFKKRSAKQFFQLAKKKARWLLPKPRKKPKP